MEWPRVSRWPEGVGQDAIPSHKGRGHDGSPGRQSRSTKCGNEPGRMGNDSGNVAVEAAGRDLERSAGCQAGREVHEQADRSRKDLASDRIPEKADGKAQSKSEQTKTRFREGSKAAQVYALLCRPEGATVHEIQDLTGWQRHSVRGFLSASVRKQGRRMRSFERQGERVYRVKS